MDAQPPVIPAPASGAASPRLSRQRYDSFVVRVQTDATSGRIVQGRVSHASSRQAVRFTDLQHVLDFITASIKLPDSPPNEAGEL